MNCEEIEIPPKKITKISKSENRFQKDGIKINIRTFFIFETVEKSLNFTEEDEEEFLQSIESKK